MIWAPVIVLGRILAESGSPPPDVADSQVLLIKRHDVVVGCTPGDGGTTGDAAIDAPGDSDGGISDGGIDDGGIGDAGTGDGGMPDAGTTCEMIPGDAVTMIVQPKLSISTDGTRFAVLLVTPARPIVEVKSYVFEPLATLTAPRIETQTVEVPDSSLGTQCESIDFGGGCGGGGYSGGGGGGGSWTPPPISDAGLGDGGVVEETVGPYQFVRAQPTSSSELAGWLDQLGYEYMPEDLDAVAPYISLGYHVVAIRVAADAMAGALEPVALTWPGSELRVPAALGRGSYAGTFTVYIAADQKYVLPGAQIRYAMYTNAMGTSFLTRNQLTLDQNKPVADDPIAVHLDNNTYQEVKVVTEEHHVPVEVPCNDDHDDGCEGGGCCSDCNAKPRTRFDLLSLVAVVAFTLRRRRRPTLTRAPRERS